MASAHAYKEALMKAVGGEKFPLALEHVFFALRALDDAEKRKLSELDEKEVKHALEKRFGDFLAQPVKNMIAVAAMQGEWEALSELAGEERSENMEAVVTTTRPLTDDMEAAFRKEITRQTPVREVRFVIDPTLLGGVRVRIGDREIDHSVKGALAKFV